MQFFFQIDLDSSFDDHLRGKRRRVKAVSFPISFVETITLQICFDRFDVTKKGREKNRETTERVTDLTQICARARWLVFIKNT